MFDFSQADVTFDTVWHHFGADVPILDMVDAGTPQPRSAEDVHREMISLLPDGWLWPTDDDTLLAAILQPFAAAIADIETTAAAMIDEIDPRSAIHMLPDFERVLGPDPCGRDPATMTLDQRQMLAHQRWTARGGASIAYFVAFAAKRGVAITISENRVSYAGEMVAGDELIDQPEQFIWTVNLALAGETLFVAGEGQAGERLYDLILNDIDCDIRRLKPAHTEVVFNYEEP